MLYWGCLMDEIKRLRAELAKRQAAATAKIARMKRTKGVQLAGTEYDPRRDPKQFKRSRDIKRQLDRLNSFIDRRTQFVPLAGGAPAPIAKWKAFHEADMSVVNLTRQDMKALGKMQVPHTGQTIEDLEATIPNKAAGDSRNRLYDRTPVKSTHVRSVEMLDKWTDQRLKQAKPEYRQSRIDSQRDSMNKMLTEIGDTATKARVAEWTDDQFYVFWNYGHNADNMDLWYRQAKAMSGSREKDDVQARLVADVTAEFEDTFQWVESLPPVLPASKTQAGKTRRRR